MSVAQTLRRIDDEITICRQEIARQQVNIARLEDTRRVLMSLEEADQEATGMRKAERLGVVAGSAGRPMLVVRKVTEDAPPEDHATQLDAPKGIVTSGPRKGLPRLRSGREGGKAKAKVVVGRKNSGQSLIRDRILEVLLPGDEPMASSDLANYLGIPKSDEARKPMQNALYNLRVTGVLQRDDQRRYYRSAVAEAAQ